MDKHFQFRNDRGAKRPPALLFFVLVLLTILIQVDLTPPMQVSDEENHFLCVVQVADGRAFGRRLDGSGADVRLRKAEA